ncbi:S phase cyclin A-associated protein in the endoplasmic reticulum-like [Contarinia nasturtii]|uniref:S phase cyclin A-associated protein in the endoplasmic reticulum-like n=1 Tax=Contarinia nasturtii TaxID=265458 RepID=UPI0012D49367|nr:S phase cyclin A-associated protein in the endoplasmic reticulum-like [Contarinia nasturtii]
MKFRLELALERQKRLERIDETRREREQRVVSMQEEREKMRQQIAREKARDREERLLALQAQQQQTTEELQRKIIQKQQESARRHEETIEHIRQRALELSMTFPSRNMDDTNSNRNDNSDHTLNDDLSSVVSDLLIETKSSKKKLKRLRSKMLAAADDYMNSLEPPPIYMKRDSAVPKIFALIKKNGGKQGMERPLGQLLRTIAKAEVFDFQCFWLMDGLGLLAQNIIKSALEPNPEISRKALIMAIQIYRDACSPCIQIARHAILGNSVAILFDVLLHSLQVIN